MSSSRLRRIVAVVAMASCFGAVAQASPAAAAPNTAGEYHAVTPARILDTRSTAAVGPAASVTVQVTGRGGVPATGVQAVVMNVTAVAPTVGGYLSVWPSDEGRPEVSSLNFVAGQTVPNLVTVKVGATGAVSIFNAAGQTHVLADVVGWYDNASVSGGWYNPLTPARLLDTRSTGPVGPNTAINLQVTGRGGVPANGVQAVVLNVTAVDPSGSGYATVYPAGPATARPNASTLNFTAGQTIANLVIVGLTNGSVSLYNETGNTHLIADVVGWFDTAGTQGLVFTPITPVRAVDTRAGEPLGEDQGPYAPPVAAITGVNRNSVRAVVMNVTATQTTADSYFTVYPPQTVAPTGTPRPDASNLNWKAGQTVPNAVMSGVSPSNVPGLDSGLVTVYNRFGQTHLLIDVTGYFTAPPA